MVWELGEKVLKKASCEVRWSTDLDSVLRQKLPVSLTSKLNRRHEWEAMPSYECLFQEVMALKFRNTSTLLHAVENLPVCCPWHQDRGFRLLPTCSYSRTISDAFFDYDLCVTSQVDLLALEHEQRFQNLTFILWNQQKHVTRYNQWSWLLHRNRNEYLQDYETEKNGLCI